MEKDIIKLELRVSKLEKDAEEFHKVLEPIREESIRQDEHYREIIRTLNELKCDVKELKDVLLKLKDNKNEQRLHQYHDLNEFFLKLYLKTLELKLL